MRMERKYLFATSIGNAVEYYDTMLFAFFSILIAPLFFPFENKLWATLASFGAFASSYFMRPFGGLFFGYLGDKIGRQISLKISIFIIIFPTFFVSLLPTYENIGIFSPILLVFFRMAQGFCIGGEYGGAAVYIGEKTEKRLKGFYGSILCASGSLGALLGTFLGVVCTIEIFPDWGWRIPFFIGGILSILAYRLRTNLQETERFQKFQQNKGSEGIPTLNLIKDNRANLLAASIISGAAFIPFYLSSIFGNSVLIERIEIDKSYILPINTFLLTTQTFMVIVMGYFSDKIGKKKMMRIACISLFVFALPIMFLIGGGDSFSEVFLGQILLCIIGPGLVAPIAGLFPELFPVNVRYSGVALSISIGGAVFGGTTPLIATFLTEFLNSPIAPGYYLMFGSLLAFVSLTFLQKKKDAVPMNELEYA